MSCENLSQEEKQKCNGGQGCCIYKRPDEVKGSEKKNHAERSLANQSNHQKFWNKLKNERQS